MQTPMWLYKQPIRFTVSRLTNLSARDLIYISIHENQKHTSETLVAIGGPKIDRSREQRNL